MSSVLGQQIDFAVEFVDSAGDAADPDVVEFFLREAIDGTQLQWTFGGITPPGAFDMVKDSTGNYRVPWVARKPERITGTFIGSGTIYQSVQLTAFVRHSENTLVEP